MSLVATMIPLWDKSTITQFRVYYFIGLLNQYSGHHGIISVIRDSSLRFYNHSSAFPSPFKQLPPHLGPDRVVALDREHIKQRFPLILCDLIPVSLRKCQQRLVPENWQLRLI